MSGVQTVNRSIFTSLTHTARTPSTAECHPHTLTLTSLIANINLLEQLLILRKLIL